MKLIAGNWKMHASAEEAGALAQAVRGLSVPTAVQLMVCPPYVWLERVAAILKGSPVMLGAQDCHAEAKGAFTGEISAAMIKEAGCNWVIVGHSERRQMGETDALIRSKLVAARAQNLSVLLCVGETQQQREHGEAQSVIASQLEPCRAAGLEAANVVVAYEPVWAIGSGRTPSSAEISQMHGFIKAHLASNLGWNRSTVRVLYGGSVKPANAREILSSQDVDGVLVGGASLDSRAFGEIAAAAT